MESHVNKVIRAINSLVADIKSQNFSINGLIIFGSAVRDELSPTSDVDVCVVLRDGESHWDNQGFEHIREVTSYVDSYFDNLCDVDYIFCYSKDLRNRDRVFNSITEEGRVIWQPTGK